MSVLLVSNNERVVQNLALYLFYPTVENESRYLSNCFEGIACISSLYIFVLLNVTRYYHCCLLPFYEEMAI